MAINSLDQMAYGVASNLDSFHAYREKFSDIVIGHLSDFEFLSIDMQNHFDSTKQPEEEFNRKMDFCAQLKRTVLKYCPNWVFNVVPTGSSVTGLSTIGSDLDVALHIPQAAKTVILRSPETFRKIQLNILQIVRRIITNDEEFKKRIDLKKGVELVQAQIQIIKMETTDGIECDISVVLEPFLSSMHNSHLIRHFHHIDGRFGPLCAVVKEWAASTKVKNPKDGGFNSYAMVLLVIHFLQCGTNPPILPNLQEIYSKDNFIALDQHKFPRRLDFGAPLPSPLKRIETNMASVAELFLQFAYYYADFDFQKFYISMRYARVMRRSESHSEVQNQSNKQVYIQDPFDEHNPGRTCRNLAFIKKVFKETVNKFDSSQTSNFQFPKLVDILQMKPGDMEQNGSETESAENDQSDVQTTI